MTEVRANLQKAQRALLVGSQLKTESEEVAQSLLDELGELAQTMGLTVAESCLVHVQRPHAKFYLGSGKAEEIADRAKAIQADLVVMDHDLTPGQQRNWEKLAGRPVIDREEVILEIFGRRAQTREARLQVELAQLEYSLPRLTRAWAHLGRQGGGVGGKGEGEAQLEIDRRLVNKRIERRKAELKVVRSQRATQRKQRLRRPTPVAAIVGYTNAGKSSLLRAMTGADVLIEDQLFATLDTTTRKIELPGGQTLLLTDTVGFVRKLPHRLVEAFKATLEEAAMADVLVHVLDVNNSQMPEFFRTTMDVLKELGADEKPMLTVFNKVDLDPDALARAIARQHVDNAVFISTHTGEGLEELTHRLAELVKPEMNQVQLEIPHDRYDLISRLHEEGQVITTCHEATLVRVVAFIPKKMEALVAAFVVEPARRKARRSLAQAA